MLTRPADRRTGVQRMYRHSRLIVASVTALWVGLAVVCCAQSTLIYEGFEGAFPGSWSVGDANTNGNPAYWGKVDAAFGGRTPHSGNWKGYCAGIGYAGTTNAPRYTNYMTAYMSRTLNLSNYSRVNLRFWNLVPSIETGWDYCRVLLDGTVLWSNGLPFSTWTQFATNLNAFAGTSRTLRFEFVSDYIINYEGWYLDDIEVTTGSAPIMEQLSSLVLTNYTGYVIDADALSNSPAFNRDALRVQAVFAVENFTPNTSNLTYRLQFRLLNSAGVAFPILETNGVTNATYTYNLLTNVAVGGGWKLVLTNVAAIRPAQRLNPYDTYTIECRLFRDGVDTGRMRTDGPYQFFHFTNMVSGDTALNVLARLNSVQTNRIFMVDNAPNCSNFTFRVNFETHRYDNFAGANMLTFYPVAFDYTLYTSNGAPVATKTNRVIFWLGSYSYQPGTSNPPAPYKVTYNLSIPVEPLGQLDSVHQTYYLQLTISHTNEPGQPALVGNSTNSTTERLLHFNGKLYFGSIETRFTSLANTPTPDSLGADYINTVLAVNNYSGYVVGSPTHTYGDGTPLNVRLWANGNATLASGSVVLSAPSPDIVSIQNVRFTRGPITLSTAGARANLTVTLPSGFGYTTNGVNLDALRYHWGILDFKNVSLGQTLTPLAVKLSYNPGTYLYCAEESKPVWFIVDALTWNVDMGTFTLGVSNAYVIHTRFWENYYQAYYASNTVDPPNMSFKRDNSGYYQFVDIGGMTNLPIVYANAAGAAEVSFTTRLTNGTFRTHFPYDARITWTNSGILRVERDLYIPEPNNGLYGVGPVSVPYTTTCPGCDATVMTNYPVMVPTDGRLRFTIDGGLVGEGRLSPSHTLAWGYIPGLGTFAQRVLNFTNAALHVPGHFVRGDHNLQPPEQGPATILLSGFSASDPSYVERPISPSYLVGLADYAGLNFRVYSNKWRQAISVLAGQSVGPYELSGCSKYYVRLGGVSGMHEAFPGSFPTEVNLLGYQVTFERYGVAYLDSQNVDSRTAGYLKVPYPSAFTLDFEEMKFSCVGGLLSAKVAPASHGFKKLAWWNADFEPLAVQFKSNPGEECNPDKGSLIVGVRAYASHVDEPLTGFLGFQTNGNLIAKSFGLEGIDSRLKLPSRFKLAGPTNTAYTVTPVVDAYFSSYSNTIPENLPPVGFINIVGKMSVPFFEELKVHLHTSARTNGVTPAPSIWIAGGWPRAGSGNPNYGWRIGGDDFFTAAYFDPDNFGFPPGVKLSDYRNNATQLYHPRAQKLWLGVVDFDYPLLWTDSARTFKSLGSVTNDLLVFKVQHQITYMDPANASIDFGMQYDGLPKISLANMTFNAIEGQLGVARALANAVGAEVRDVLFEGTADLDRMLASILDEFFDEIFKRTVDPTVDALYTRLQSEWNALPPDSKGQFPDRVSMVLSNYLIGAGTGAVLTNVTRQLMTLADGAAQPLGLLKELADMLDEITNAISAITDTISKGTNGVPLGTVKDGLLKLVDGQRPLAKRLVGELVGQLAEEFLSAVVEPHLGNLMKEVEPTLQQIVSRLNEVQAALGEIRAKVAVGQEFAQELDTKLKAGAAELTNATIRASLEVREFFNGLNYAIDDPFVHYSADEIKRLIRQRIREHFLETAVAANIQVSLKQRIYDLDAVYREAVDSVFQQLNYVIRQLIGQTLAQLDKTINDALGDLSDVIGAGQIDGHALINGNSLKMLRLDGRFRWRVPEDMEFNGYLIVKELDSSATAGCGFTGDTATEVTLGANGVKLDWISPDLHADVATKFSFQNSPFKPLGLAGSFSVTGGLNFESFKIYRLDAAVAFGLYENYLAAMCGIKIQSYDLSGGIFFGRTCTLAPIELIDPDVAAILGAPPFTGAYMYGEGWVPISEAVLGIPASCLFNISAGIGAGAFFFLEGPTYGGVMKAGVLGEALCIVTIKGEVKMVGLKSGDSLRFNGKGRLTGKVGWCPFCVKFGKTVTITYQNGSWDVDY